MPIWAYWKLTRPISRRMVISLPALRTLPAGEGLIWALAKETKILRTRAALSRRGRCLREPTHSEPMTTAKERSSKEALRHRLARISIHFDGFQGDLNAYRFITVPEYSTELNFLSGPQDRGARLYGSMDIGLPSGPNFFLLSDPKQSAAALLKGGLQRPLILPGAADLGEWAILMFFSR